MRPSKLHPLALVVFVALVAALPVRAATALALLPATGDAPRTTRSWVDEELRAAAALLDGVELQDADETRGHVASLEDLGMRCSAADVQCLVKLGIVAGVDGLLVPALELGGQRVGGEVEVELHLIDVAGATRARTVTGMLAPGDAPAARRVLRRALGIERASEGARPPREPPGAAPATFAGAAPAASAGASAEPGIVPWPLIAVGAGGIITAGALTTAIVSDLLYAGVLPGADAQTRRDVMQPLGATMWIVTGLGALTAGAGAIFALQDPPSPDDPPSDMER